MHPAASFLCVHDSAWLVLQRARRVNPFGGKNTLLAGQTGTRLNIGRPQVRWSDGERIAASLQASRATSLDGSNALSITNRIRETLDFLRIQNSDRFLSRPT